MRRRPYSTFALLSQLTGFRREPPQPPGYWSVADGPIRPTPPGPDDKAYDGPVEDLAVEMLTRTATAIVLAVGLRLRKNKARHLIGRYSSIVGAFIGRDSPSDPKVAALELAELSMEVGKMIAEQRARARAEEAQAMADALRGVTRSGRSPAPFTGGPRSTHAGTGAPCDSCGQVHEPTREAGPLVAQPIAQAATGPLVTEMGHGKYVFMFREAQAVRMEGMVVIVKFPTAGLDPAKAVVLRTEEGDHYLRGEVALDPMPTDTGPVVLPYFVALRAQFSMTSTVRPVAGGDSFRWTASGDLEHVIPLEAVPSAVVPVQPHHTN